MCLDGANLIGYLHEYGQVVGGGEVFLVVGESLEEGVVEDVVDADGFTASEGVHPACSALLESVDHIAQHGVVDERVGDVVEVAAQDAGLLGGALLVGNGDGLPSTEHHAQGVVAEDGVEHTTVADAVVGIGILGLKLAGLMHGAVKTGGFQVDIEHTNILSLHIDVGPHGTLVGIVEEQGLAVFYRITAEDYHVAAACGHIGEVFLVTLGILLVAADFVILLQTEDIDLMATHLCQDVLSQESGSLATEHRHIVGGNLQTLFGFGLLVDGAKLYEGADIGNAACNSDDGNECVEPFATYEPVDKQHEVECNEHRQDVNQHGAG